ncbi:hypothetical protein TRFO_04398 [Tritrichomonas foetus]|uniref:Uncharacterized protein n=1 Tax=Tritrichomonas foetus TaxID=1144522 RepID=A0A1J4KFS5_9EUKA|nr:hypothetical protein TRFO_04398 [Tritrichomonas foetus]|eukprot:OHT09866.1 hypothetical protein TRFO_04398 [Tritrichomonas foetus]
MDKSCENYSDLALYQRRKLQEVNSDFKKIDQTVKNTLNLVRRDQKTNLSTRHAATRPATSTSANISKNRNHQDSGHDSRFNSRTNSRRGRRSISASRPRTAPTQNFQHNSRNSKDALGNESRMIIRPAPFPVKNYILPSQELVGPKRYFRSKAFQQRKESEMEIIEEFEKYPNSFDISPIGKPPEMVVTPTKTFNFSEQNDGFSFDNDSCGFDNYI